ncbi:transcriptional repressor LexA [Sporanaerobacter acetigenes]|uniref:LexA repressor n=1 Tax=Sporanaerobacter acetigenes DSM 13106 TaxID=1123281 RepID=A0A1M5XL70_9FIRM|nr:transcriptional repressor LexA [Sporanaerobacter acetigenes]SHI00496.1 SOS-response transcriptional repressor, LexA [Sporanaerobacter acetigenes DSM 13106]
MYEDLSQKQIEILEFIKREIQLKGYPPAVREICSGVNLKSTSTVHGHLEKLEKKGYIRKDPTKPRAIEVLDRDEDYLFAPKKTVDIPIIGKVTAGQPILAVENIEDTFPIPLDIAERGPLFMLKVQGESMIEAGIFNGDYVLVRQKNDAENGDIVVALLEDEATVKKFYKEENYIRLQPENETMSPILTRDVKVLGKVIGLYRKL